MKRGWLVVLVLALTLSVTPAFATMIIDFGTGLAGQGGTITFLNGGAKGVGIPVGTVTIAGIPPFNGDYLTSGTFSYSFTFPPPIGTLDLTAAVLDFDYEPNLAQPINTLTITGNVEGLVASEVVLLSGSFSSFETNTENGMGIEGSGPDTKGREFMDALGLDPLIQWQFFGFSLTGEQIPGSDSWYAISTDFRNTVPEPGILILLGIGLSAVGLFSRRIK